MFFEGKMVASMLKCLVTYLVLFTKEINIMKKIIAFILVAVMCTSIAGCGKTMCSVDGCENEAVEDRRNKDDYCSKHFANQKAFKASKEAYEYIDAAYVITEELGSDIYEAWRLGIYDRDEIVDEGIEYLADELSLDEDEVRYGLAYALTDLAGDSWDELSDEEKEVIVDNADGALAILEDDMFAVCVLTVIAVYTLNGKLEEVQTALDEAKSEMKKLSESYSDYEHYPNLKGYYTTTSSYFGFCQEPSGSFEQVKDTINEYTKEARDYISDLDYIFEE